MPTNEEITRHRDPDPDEDPWVNGPPPPAPIEIRDYDDTWPATYCRLASMIRDLLGERVLAIQHVGSTSVPGLAAKPVIDIDLTVPDPADEAAYVPRLVAAGFEHRVREPSWHEHRCLTHEAPAAFLHVFGPDCPEVVRHRMFRDWLRQHPDDLAIYRDAKLAAAAEFADGHGRVMDYNRHKEPVVREIYDRMFRAHGML